MSYKVLFICAGNICRSPLAEGIFKQKCKEAGLESKFEIDSAGMGAWHVGDAADHRSQEVAIEHGFKLEGKSRQFKMNDFKDFDLILAMDQSNMQDLKQLANKEHLSKLKLMRAYDETQENDVPDPYFGRGDGFKNVYHMLDICCTRLFQDLQKKVS